MGFAEGFAIGSNARAQRDAIQLQKETRDQELEKQGYDFSSGKMQVRDGSAAQAEQLQAQEATQLAKSLQGKLLAQATDGAFEDYAHTGDAGYIQKALATNPELKTAWAQRGVQTVDNVNFDQDHKLLQQAGLKPTDYDSPEKRDVLKKNFYKVYDGKDWNLSDAHDAAAQTGVMNRLGERRGGVITQNFDNVRNLILEHRRAEANAAKGTTNENIDQEVTNQTNQVKNQAAGVAVQAAGVAENRRQFDASFPLEERKVAAVEQSNVVQALTAQAKLRTEGRTETMKNLDAAEVDRVNLTTEFGGEEQFFKTDFSKPENLRKALKGVIRIEKLTGTEPSESQRKEISDLSAVINLGDPASKLSDSQTGVFDSKFSDLKKYVFDNVDGVQASTAYNTMRNVLRHDLYGSVVPLSEEQAFNGIMASLGTKAGPVLQQLRGQLDQTRNKLATASQFMDPMAAQVRLGKNQEQVNAIIDRLDKRIAKLSGVITPETKKAKLGNIFGTAPAGP